jgi:hypothetical protein
VADSFRQAVLDRGGSSTWSSFGTMRLGSAPAPFDAVGSNRLVGPSGSHPLAAISIDELVRRSSDSIDGTIALNGPIRIGEAISGTIKLTALQEINGRSAMIRLLGVLLTEDERSDEKRDSQGRVTSTERWVQVSGDIFEDLPFSQPALPATLAAGQTFESEFTLPAPRLGPPSAHMGSAIIAWALDAKWDVSMRGDQRVTAIVDVQQNIDYLRSGAVRLEQGALFDAWTVNDATIAVKPIPPVVAGSEIEVTVTWPGAGSGRGGRLELQADVQAPNGISDLVLFSMPVDPAAFRGGLATKIPVPLDAPPTLNDKGVAVNYIVRALVDRQLRSDLAVERAIAVM